MDEYYGGFHFLAFECNAATNIFVVRVSYARPMFSVLLGIHLGEELLVHMVTLRLVC